MKLLLDTHIFLWHMTNDPRQPPRFQAEIRDPANQVFLSVASVWEITIKHAIGKLPLPAPPAQLLPHARMRQQLDSLVIDEGVISYLAALPLHHHDPFDRLLVAQSMQHNLTIATVDHVLVSYSVPFLPTT